MRWEAGRTEFYVTCPEETPDCFIRLPPGGDPIAARYCSRWCNLPFPLDISLLLSYPWTSHRRQILSLGTKCNNTYLLEEDVHFQNGSLLLLSSDFLHCWAAEDCSFLSSDFVLSEQKCAPSHFSGRPCREWVLCCRASRVSSAAFSGKPRQVCLEG